MAEQVILVCDECGRPATKSVMIRIDGRNLVKDLCDADARALTRNARTPRRGRKAATVLSVPGAAGARRGPGRPKDSRNKKSTAKRSTAKRATAKRSTAKRSTAKRSTAKRSTAKRATARSAAKKPANGRRRPRRATRS